MSSPSFRDRTRSALKDDHLHTALERATQQLKTRRKASLDSLHDADAVRDFARDRKLNTLSQLDRSLLDFEANLKRQGIIVHWAKDGPEASQLVLDIAQRNGVQSIVKSKSMVTEEIHLNKALEKEGLEVIETDLGEYIVQLDEDRPSHIILPIIHKTREDVGRLFEEKLEKEYTPEPATLTAYARAELREKFLQADMGITGANFGIVESGGIGLVSNEGNICMVTSLPRVHVAILGLEKIIPTLDDFDAFIKILARSATGQKITVYTSLIHGPKRSPSEAAPEEVHVILLDNGRSDTLAGDQAEILACIRCGACLNACPVYQQIGGHAYGDTYPGPMGSILTPTLRDKSEWNDLPQASSLCGACQDVCPVRIQIPKLLLSLRQEQVSRGEVPWSQRIAMRLFAFSGTHPRLTALLHRVSRLGLSPFLRSGWISKLPTWFPLMGEWTRTRELKAPKEPTFQEWFRDREGRS